MLYIYVLYTNSYKKQPKGKCFEGGQMKKYNTTITGKERHAIIYALLTAEDNYNRLFNESQDSDTKACWKAKENQMRKDRFSIAQKLANLKCE